MVSITYVSNVVIVFVWNSQKHYKQSAPFLHQSMNGVVCLKQLICDNKANNCMVKQEKINQSIN